jgi:hypothetical protein
VEHIINRDRLREGPPHIASTYGSSTNNYDHNKKPDDTKNYFQFLAYVEPTLYIKA